MNKKLSEQKNKSTFVRKLYQILKNQSNQNIIKWIDNGTAFMICEKQQFVSEILKQHYKHSKFSSFLKQLSVYGFKRVFDRAPEICYQHPLFTQDFVDFNLAKRSIRKEPQYIVDDAGFFNLMQELKLISQNQVMMCEKLEQCKQIQSIASSQITALNYSMLDCLERKREAEHIKKMLISIVSGMESQFQSNTQILYDELFHNSIRQELSISEFTTPLSLQFTPTPIQKQEIQQNKAIRKNIINDPDFIWNNNEIQ